MICSDPLAQTSEFTSCHWPNHGHFGQSAQTFYEEPDLNMN